MSSKQPLYRRVLIKLSGEALSGDADFGIDLKAADKFCHEIAKLQKRGIQVALVIGGGNLFRGTELKEQGLNRITGDQMGMLATLMNGLALQERFRVAHVPVTLMSSFRLDGVCDAFDRHVAIQMLEQGSILIFSGGTGNPMFTTDSAASLRAAEIEADALLKATKVDGVYSADPMKDPTAKRFTQLNYQEVIDQQLKVMDLTAVCLAQETGLTIQVFNMNEPNILEKIIFGEEQGTIVSN